jgi:hypothetical protein
MRRLIAIVVTLSAAGALAQGKDPRTADGQLAVCGGAASWQAVGYLDFTVRVDAPTGPQGPWRYRWDRHDNYVRVSGKGLDGADLDVTLDIGSRSGGGVREGKPLTGAALASAVDWAFGRFGQDSLWLTFPLEWSAAGVTVAPQPNATADTRMYLATRIASSGGNWEVWLDPKTGHIVRTLSARPGGGVMTVWWSDWKSVAGVLFATQRRVAETKETFTVTVDRALPSAPADAF